MYNKEWYQEHKQEEALRVKKWRENNQERSNKYHKEYKIKHKESIRKYHNKHYHIMKNKLFDILGGKRCVICGFSDIRALQFDHINGDGYKERRKCAITYYYKYINDPELAKKKFQVLCANCNWIKRYENKEHK